MDLFGFIKAANFKADARELVKFMKWNVSLKKKLNEQTGDVVTLTTDEVVELLESVHQLINKIRLGVGTTQTAAVEVKSVQSEHKRLDPYKIEIKATQLSPKRLKLVDREDDTSASLISKLVDVDHVKIVDTENVSNV
ncbi:ORF1629 [Clostera anastomosis granulovirus A]|uniref:ORF1629 n=1 Tax=Clostera anastomosis granulovirus A TaxID=1986289 RepID=U5KB28_9BBAC|nr:ORF1629 [Clostera anastomosis granulovirus Henan]AGQ20261.1 ORF1629 [Clostera anastomosis granulovirus Henan]